MLGSLIVIIFLKVTGISDLIGAFLRPMAEHAGKALVATPKATTPIPEPKQPEAESAEDAFFKSLGVEGIVTKE